MLVLSNNLVLSAAAAALPSGTPLILYDNIVTPTNIVATDEDSNFPATNLANPSTEQEWRGADDGSPVTGAFYLTVTTNTVEEIAAVGIARHNFGSAAIAVSVERYDGLDESSPANEVWTEVVQPQIPANDEPLLLVFTSQSMEKVRVKLAEGSDLPRAAVLYVGPLLRCERGMPMERAFTPPRFGRKTEVVTGKSERGDYLSRIVISRSTESDITFEKFTAAWYRTNFDPFLQSAEQDVPFFLAWSPDDYPDEVAYCWLTADPAVAHSHITGRMDVSLKLGGIFE